MRHWLVRAERIAAQEQWATEGVERENILQLSSAGVLTVHLTSTSLN
jgi:hypothetical protein